MNSYYWPIHGCISTGILPFLVQVQALLVILVDQRVQISAEYIWKMQDRSFYCSAATHSSQHYHSILRNEEL